MSRLSAGFGVLAPVGETRRLRDSVARLEDRTLTKLYNAPPAWLTNAHAKLDAAVCAAYGWPATVADDDLLARLLALNLARVGSAAPAADGDAE